MAQSRFIARGLVTAALAGLVANPAVAQTAPTAPPPAVPSPATLTPAATPPVTDATKQPSFHLRCDGKPPHMSGGESFARFMGAVTLLGLFAPRPEQADPEKRLKGAEGIAACNELIDGPHAESNGLRRLELILARSIHRMEAKDYTGAFGDVEKARAEAQTLGLVGNPYFDQSFGLSFDLLGSQDLFLSGDIDGARRIGYRSAQKYRFGFFPMMSWVFYSGSVRTFSADEDAALSARDKVIPRFVQAHAARLEELGRFADAAQLRDALLAETLNLDSEAPPAWLTASAALSWAMAGDWTRAEDHATRARAAIDKADADGKPDGNRSGVIEALDLLAVLRTAHEGHLDEARRLFAGRSEWSPAMFGIVAATNHMLRQGARPDQLVGALAQSDDQMWKTRDDKSRASLLAQVADGKREYFNILPFARVDEYEKTSRKVWKGDRTGIIADKPFKNSKFYRLDPVQLEPIYRVVAPDSQLLDAAIIAKARGFKGFVFVGSNATWSVSFVEFGNPGDADMIPQFYLDADAVIAELRPLIPSPEDLAAREKAGKS